MLEARAVYEHGQLRLLDTVTLREGDQVRLTITPESDPLALALGDLLRHYDADATTSVDEDAILQEIDAALAGQSPVSESIIEERRTGR